MSKATANMQDRLLEALNAYGRKRAVAEGIPYRLSSEDVISIIQNQVSENERYLTPSTIQHYEKLMFGAVVACNRLLVEEAAQYVGDALVAVNANRNTR